MRQDGGKPIICYANIDPEGEQTWWGVRERETFFLAWGFVVQSGMLGILKVFVWCNLSFLWHELRGWLAVFTGSFPAADWWLYCDHRNSVWRGVLPSSPCSFSTVCQILAKFSCYSSRMSKMLSQPLLLEEDDIVYCMSKILWNELLSTKIKVLFNTGTGMLC